MKDNVDQTVLLEDDLEMGFDEALDNLQKSLNPAIETLSKSEDEPKKGKSEVVDEDEDEEEDEETDDDDMEKSMVDILSENEEAEAAMDVEPFLFQLAKAIDESISSVRDRVANVESLAKSIGQMTAVNAKLSKSMSDTVTAIGGQPVPTKAHVALAKSSRFGEGDNAVEASGEEILIKSQGWLKDKKISLLEAGNIEGRVNKGVLVGSVGDALDNKTMTLLKEDAK